MSVAKGFAVVCILASILVLSGSIISDESIAEDSIFENVVIDGDFYYVLEDGYLTLLNYTGSDHEVHIPSTVVKDDITYPVYGVHLSSFQNGESVFIPDTILGVDEAAWCNIGYIEVDENNLLYESEGGVMYTKDMTSVVRYPCNTGDNYYYAPLSVRSIEPGAFAQCSDLEEVFFISLISIGENAFMNDSNLKYVNYMNGVNNIPNGTVIVDDYAFMGCTSLENISFPESLRIIGSSAFEDCIGFTELKITEGLMSISDSAFNGCKNIVRFTADNLKFFADDGVLFHRSSSDSTSNFTLYHYPAGSSREKYTIPSTVSDLEAYAFNSTQHLKELKLSTSLTSLPELSVVDCPSLEKVTLSANILSIDTMALCRCDNLQEIEWNSKISIIGDLALFATGFKELVIPDSVEIIGYGAFLACKNLERVTLPEGLELLQESAFSVCNSLKEIEFTGTTAMLEGNSLSVNEGQEVDVLIPKGMTLSDDASTEGTILNIIVKGERPYPYENFIGVAICILVLIGIMRLFREV